MALTTKREHLDRWIEKKGVSGIQQYQQEKNQISMDGKKTR
jgi:hypothetical protein